MVQDFLSDQQTIFIRAYIVVLLLRFASEKLHKKL